MFDRGFKTWCERLSLQERKALGLQPVDPLDPLQLAARKGILVKTPRDVPGLEAESLKTLTNGGSEGWSAVTVAVGSRAVILLNATHSKGRAASDLMHEVAHLVIGHSGSRVDVAADGSLLLRTYDKKQELEANWLAGCLLLPREALLHIHRNRVPLSAALQLYGVSRDMLDYRMQVTGVLRQVSRWR